MFDRETQTPSDDLRGPLAASVAPTMEGSSVGRSGPGARLLETESRPAADYLGGLEVLT